GRGCRHDVGYKAKCAGDWEGKGDGEHLASGAKNSPAPPENLDSQRDSILQLELVATNVCQESDDHHKGRSCNLDDCGSGSPGRKVEKHRDYRNCCQAQNDT